METFGRALFIFIPLLLPVAHAPFFRLLNPFRRRGWWRLHLQETMSTILVLMPVEPEVQG